MDKKSLHHFWRVIRPIKAWYLLAACLTLGVIAVIALRQNYQSMTVLRDRVYVADERDEDVEKALQNLRTFVSSHMNTDLSSGSGVYPPIQLKYTYERTVAAEKARVEATNSRVYTDAQRHCEALFPQSFSGGPRTPCIAEYVKSHGTSAQPILDAVYKFDFASPRWSPDLAGWSMVLAGLFLLLAILRLLLGFILKRVT
jgi:hypothetical protein